MFCYASNPQQDVPSFVDIISGLLQLFTGLQPKLIFDVFGVF